VPTDLDVLIETVRIGPRADEAMLNAVQEVMQRAELKRPVAQSGTAASLETVRTFPVPSPPHVTPRRRKRAGWLCNSFKSTWTGAPARSGVKLNRCPTR
jgi:hypothetical protein